MTQWYDKKVPKPMDRPMPKPPTRRRDRVHAKQDPAIQDQRVKEVCLGVVAAHRPEYTQRIRAGHEVAQVYFEKLAVYYHTRPKNWRDRINRNNAVLGCCLRAAYQADMLEVPIVDYIEAQFWFFDTAFRRPPRYRDIAGPNANQRYLLWVERKESDRLPEKTINLAAGAQVDPKHTPASVEVVYEETMLGHMVRDWGSEERVWELFGDVENDTFPLWFKQGRAVWNKMYNK